MNRRKFIQQGLATTGAITVSDAILAEQYFFKNFASIDKILNAYYFRAHMYF